MALTEVILREKINNLGAEADVVKVKAGFARNFLIPSGKAYEATKGNLRQIENLRTSRATRETEELNKAQELATKISRFKPKFTLDVGKNGKAFGSVTSIDIHKALEDKGIIIDRTAIQLDKPIKSTGKTDVEVKIHADVTTSVTITVSASEETAS
ncbi:MAG: large subunit ribosomal protein L9 [Akkermansiaceae bacterium]|jgi:large subunit ribosomal protein L9